MIGADRVGGPAARLPRGWPLDLAAAALLTAFLLLGSGRIEPPSGGHTLDAGGYLLLVLAGASAALCRRRPRLAVALVAAVLGCYLGRGYPDGPIYLAGMASLFSLGRLTDRRSALLGGALLLVVLTVTAMVRAGGATPLPLIFLGWAAASVLAGDAVRSRRAQLAVNRERARGLELTRAERTRRQIAEDRLRIARDLHDTVGHAMAMINVQASAGAHVADRRPEAAKQALQAIQAASADVLDELTAMLSVLRADGDAAERAPTPGLGQLPELVRASGNAALRTHLEIEGPVEQVPDAVAVAAYRIVQESLTNVLRHARATEVRVSVRAGAARDLVVEVRDDGGPAGAAGPPSSGGRPGSGIGIRGMRERAESSGGELVAGPGPDGGFAVRAAWGPRG